MVKKGIKPKSVMAIVLFVLAISVFVAQVERFVEASLLAFAAFMLLANVGFKKLFNAKAEVSDIPSVLSLLLGAGLVIATALVSFGTSVSGLPQFMESLVSVSLIAAAVTLLTD